MSNDMLIHYDLDEVMETLTPLEQNYKDFLNLSKSFLGWLLTLDGEEFEEVQSNLLVDLKKPPENWGPMAFLQIEMWHKDKPITTLTELEEEQAIKRQYVTWIQAVKDGTMSYVADDDDMLWEFKVTPKGILHLKKEGIIKEDENYGKDND